MTLETTVTTLFKGKDINTVSTAEKIDKSIKKISSTQRNSSNNITKFSGSITDAVNASSNAFSRNQGIIIQAGISAKETLMGKFVPSVKATTSAAKMATGGWTKFFTSFQAGFLSMMFGGMQLQRVMGGLIKGMIANFKELSVATDPTRIALTRLEGSIKFLKFQIVEATGPLIMRIADWISDLAVSIAQANPEKLKSIGIAIGAIWTLGFALFNIGQFGTFVTGLGNLIMSLGGAAGGAAATNAAKISAGLRGIGGTIAIGMGLAEISKGAYDLSKGDVENAVVNFAQGIAELSAGALIFKGKTAAGGALLALAMVMQLEQERASMFDRSFIAQTIIDAASITGTIIGLFAAAWWEIENTFRNSLMGKILGMAPMEGTASDAFASAFAKQAEGAALVAQDVDKLTGTLERQAEQQKLVNVETADYIGNIDKMVQEHPALFAINNEKITQLSDEEQAAKLAALGYKELAAAKREAARAGTSNDSGNNQSGEVNMTYTG